MPSNYIIKLDENISKLATVLAKENGVSVKELIDLLVVRYSIEAVQSDTKEDCQ